MEVFGHMTTAYAALRRCGLSHEEALRIIREHGVKLMLTDNIRAAVTGEGVTPYGRGYSHFTDGCGMVLPYGEELKNYTNIHQTTFEHNEGYVNKFADQPTDFAKFIRMNPEMFTPKNQSWGICTLAHLAQDVNSDDLWQRRVCKCDTDNDVVVYNYTGRVVNGKQFRLDMATANVYMHNMFVGYIRNVLDAKEFNEEEFLDAVFTSIDRWYHEDIATKTKSYFNLDPCIFGAEHEDMKEKADEVLNTHMFCTRKQLDGTCIQLFEDCMASLNTAMNLLVHMK